MSSNSDDIQAAGSDTRPPMLDRTDYDSWSQRIRLYCRGKENGIYILQSIDHGPFELGTTRDTLGTTPEGGVLLGPERPRTYDDLNDNDKKRFDADVRATNIVLQGLPKDIYKLINHNIEAKAIWDNVKMLLAGSELTKEDRESQLYDEFERFKMLPGENINEYYNQNQRNFARGAGAAGNGGAHNRAGNSNVGQGKPIKCYNFNGLGHIARNCTQPKHPQNSDFFKDKMLLMQAQENGEILDEEELLFLAGEQTNTFDADVDDQPSIFMANLSSTGPANLQADPSDASILSEVHDLENTIDHCDDNQDKHETHNKVQQKHVIDSNGADMVTELNIYKQQVAMYERRAKFDLTLHEQIMDEQMSILIQDRNKKEENLKKELHSVKLQLNSNIKSNKIIEETVTTLKHEFKQKETKFLTNFSNLTKLNDKLENKLYSQDHSIQTVHMMLKPKKLYDQDAVTAIGAQNPFYLRKAKMVQPALYDGDEILKTHHVPVSVTSSEEDLEIAKITRQKMNEKMNDPVCVEKKIKIIPPNYSKENYLATFTPQTQLTPE
ncbi:hypothetical protein Tco_0079632 [Tanacetum coccineum]